MFTACTRKQHCDNLAVVLCCLLAAFGVTQFNQSTTKSPGAISRFLNHQAWCLKTLIRVMRHHTLETFRTHD